MRSHTTPHDTSNIRRGRSIHRSTDATNKTHQAKGNFGVAFKTLLGLSMCVCLLFPLSASRPLHLWRATQSSVHMTRQQRRHPFTITRTFLRRLVDTTNRMGSEFGVRTQRTEPGCMVGDGHVQKFRDKGVGGLSFLTAHLSASNTLMHIQTYVCMDVRRKERTV